MTRFDRRRLLTSGAAAAVLLGAGVGASAAPKRGGLLRAVLSGGAPDDCWRGGGHRQTFMMVATQGAVFDTLTEVAPDGTLRGELLERWETPDGGRTWDLFLREDVHFHDGSPLTPLDVGDCILGHHNSGVGTMRNVARVRLPWTRDPRNRVRVTLHVADPRFPYLLSDPRVIVHRAGTRGGAIGTGLYRAERFEPGRVFEGRRVADHPRSGRAGWFDEMQLAAVNTRAEQERMLRDRRADVADLARIEGEGFALHRVAADPAGPDFAGLDAATGYTICAHHRVARPERLGRLWPMDNARIAERWWMA